MPTQNNYYASHHRRPSQGAHTNVPGQDKFDAEQAQPTQADVLLLPATTYSKPAYTKSRKLSLNTGLPVQTLNQYEPSPDPHEFYRQHQFPATGVGTLSQNSLKVESVEPLSDLEPLSPAMYDPGTNSASVHGRTAQQNHPTFTPSSLYEASKSTPALTTPLRSRKSSFRDLVAKFDLSKDSDVPPLPSHPSSRVASQTVSPTTTWNQQHHPLATLNRGVSTGAAAQSALNSQFLPSSEDVPNLDTVSLTKANFAKSANSSSRPIPTDLNIDIPTRRPLFGEVTPNPSGIALPGYGIVTTRRRSGSVGSPMHSPNPIFPKRSPSGDTMITPGSPTTWYQATAMQPNGNHSIDHSALSRPTHQRANSDLVVAWTGMPHQRVEDIPSHTQTAQGAGQHVHIKRNSQSRIPVSNLRQSATSDSGRSTPPSRATSKLDKHTVHAAPKQSPGKQASPKRTPRTPIRIKSPGGRTQATTTIQGSKSPSLRANIIAPPPKISPPLRSSRPRLPVSSATTAASRAKMAEKFSTMQKQNNNKRSTTRKPSRPPELNDIDLEARRLKITQALTRSRQGAELRGELPSQRIESVDKSRNNSRSSSQHPESPEVELPTPVPAVVIRKTTGSDNDAFTPPSHVGDQNPSIPGRFPVEEASPTRAQSNDDTESPTLGRVIPAKPAKPLLDTRVDKTDNESELCSAVTADTAETEATMIDAEPQAEFTRPTLPERTMLSQIMRMRSPSHSSHSTSSGSSGDGHNSLQHADAESVQIILRNTSYMDGETPFEHVPLSSDGLNRTKSAQDVAHVTRNSWASSVEDHDIEECDASATTEHEDVTSGADDGVRNRAQPSSALLQFDQDHWENTTPETLRSTIASDVGTIVNFVLQQNSMSGMVDDAIADQVYNRILSRPDRQLGPDEVQQICKEIVEEHNARVAFDTVQSPHLMEGEDELGGGSSEPYGDSPNSKIINDPESTYGPSSWPQKPVYMSHRQKASLDSAEDWADTSPSVGSWAQYATSPTEPSRATTTSHLRESLNVDSMQGARMMSTERQGMRSATDVTPNLVRSQTAPSMPKPPSRSPPLPPLPHVPFAPQQGTAGIVPSTEPTVYSYPRIIPPQVPQRVTSSIQMLTQSSQNSSSWLSGSSPRDAASEGRPSLERPSMDTNSIGSSPTPEQRKLKQRRHVLKEMVDTEARFEKDMKVLSDIYRATAYPSLTHEDINVLFGNADQVLHFVSRFLVELKQGAKPTYVIDRSDRYRKDHDRPMSQVSESSHLNDAEKDMQTHIGAVFENLISEMGIVYGDYIRNHDAANRKLQSVQQNSLVQQWLKECKENSADLTSAWDLDSLLVKPVQRILKYPLLLTQLIDSTPEEHPDKASLRNALQQLTDLNAKINEAKKQAELLEQALGRKRKDSDVRIGFSKALGRRTEKLRQHVGMSEMFEDREYEVLKKDFTENSSHLVVVIRDIEIYSEHMNAWVTRMCELALASEAWLDVSQTRHATAESKLRQFAILVRRISTHALPEHLARVQKTVIEPMQKAFKMFEQLATDPKGLLQKRDKRLIDYARYRNLKDRGEKLDKKTVEKMEQWEALNVEAKIRIRKLLNLSSRLVQTAQDNYVKLHLAWLDMCTRKFSSALSIPLDKLEILDIEREWQEDFDYQQATALSLSICNGSLLAEAVNMVSFLTPSSTLNGDDSPRQPSWNSSNNRAISLNGDNTQSLSSDFSQRQSGNFQPPIPAHIPGSASVSSSHGRIRATSVTSGHGPRTPEIPLRGSIMTTQTPSNLGTGRPGTSPGGSIDTSFPRLSVDAPSPSIGPLRAETPPLRPESASTFFSTFAGPSQHHPHSNVDGAGIFSSAMPMSDSPLAGEAFGAGTADRNGRVLFTAASVYEFNIDRSRREAGFPYLTYVTGEIFDVVGERGELWLARNQDDPQKQVGWIWNKHFAKLAV